ncbi:hypothetical protein FS799_00995 [Agrobacterium vitis]|uniref:hypothetical protein n=1 Tax=Agrobacterium vitis TaxID=373 RepID=UPI001F15B159|nr:hypothetical protein [Agrobacterium vitis]MCE6073432.1 hypothetical protein [Agrobacterium vitis]
MSDDKERHKYTPSDYLILLLKGQEKAFDDYDNSAAFFSLTKSGLAEIDQSKGLSVWTSMFQQVWMRLTPAGELSASEITRLRAELDEARDKAFEEAAKAAEGYRMRLDQYDDGQKEGIATAIRAMKRGQA